MFLQFKNLLMKGLLISVGVYIGYSQAQLAYQRQIFETEIRYQAQVAEIEKKSVQTSAEISNFKENNDEKIETLQEENRRIQDNLNGCKLSNQRLNTLLAAKNQSNQPIQEKSCADLMEYAIDVTSKYQYCKKVHEGTQKYFEANGITEKSYEN